MSSDKSRLLSSEKLSQEENDDSEREPEGNESIQGEPFATVQCAEPYDLPPPYTSLPSDGSVISCNVCHSMINIAGKEDQPVVKCNNCNEVTPLRDPPLGKRYVRCTCNCLLICNSNARTIGCPRPHCMRVVNMPSSDLSPHTPINSAMSRWNCGHCHNVFLFDISAGHRARCPRCKKVTRIGNSIKRKAIFCIILGILVFTLSIAATVATTVLAIKHGGMFVVLIGLPIFGLACIAHGSRTCALKESIPQEIP